MGINDMPPVSSKMYNAFEQQQFDGSKCFICGIDLNADNGTKEHVIPLWVQNRFRLHTERMVLLNHAEIPYKQLTIQCCKSCNGDLLSPIENKVGMAVFQGSEAVKALDPILLFQWLGKIYYGLLFKELFLIGDRSRKEASTITTPELLAKYQLHHSFLQSIRIPMIFKDCKPASILVFDTQVPPDAKYQWDFIDGLPNMFIACRMGSVGIIAVFQDGGVHEQLFPHLDEYIDRPLHPIQFKEIAAKIYAKSMTCVAVPGYRMYEQLDSDQPIEITQTSLSSNSDGSLHDDMDLEQYARLLSALTGYPINTLYAPPDKVGSWLVKDGKPMNLDFDNYPWPN